MKKTIFAFAAISVAALVLMNGAKAQTAESNLGIAGTKYLEISMPYGEATFINSGSQNLNTINIKAVRDFARNYKSVTSEKWYKVSNGFLARFQSDSIENMAAYDLHGNWKFTIRYYDERKLPDEVRAIVKRNYYDCSITRVEEIHADARTIYRVHMQDDNTWKNVRVCDGEIQSVEEFNKN